MRLYPALVAKLVFCFDAWIVGSAAKADAKDIRDYDLIISPSMWNKAAQLIPADARPNTFGGWKCISDGIEVDVWPEELNNFLTNSKAEVIYHPRSGRRLVVKE